eukprot:3106400-Rhodomonas_salina.1
MTVKYAYSQDDKLYDTRHTASAACCTTEHDVATSSTELPESERQLPWRGRPGWQPRSPAPEGGRGGRGKRERG